MIQRKFLILIVALVLSCFSFTTYASETSGTILSSYNNVWSDSIGWINFKADASNVSITDDGITGYLWSETHGWINLNPAESGLTVAADGSISGYAWGENTGYINFNNVTINSDGTFRGTATGTIVGTINFDSGDHLIITDFRPSNFRTVTPESGGGGGGGRGSIGSILQINQNNEETELDAITSIYIDIDINSKYYAAIKHFTDLGILEGYPDQKFRPNKPINRAEFMKVLIKAAGITPDPLAAHSCFSDVAKEWFAPYVCYAYTQKWVQGYEDGTFGPEKIINKAEALKMIIEVLEIGDPKVNTEIWYQPYLTIAKEKNLINDVLKPDSILSRAEAIMYIFSASQTQ